MDMENPVYVVFGDRSGSAHGDGEGRTTGEMTSAERAAVTMGFEEPDRVPLFTIYGAKDLGLSIREYSSKLKYVAAGQMRLLEKFGGIDCPAHQGGVCR